MATNKAGTAGAVNGVLVPVAGDSEYLATTTTAATLNGTALDANSFYRLSVVGAAVIRQGASPTASLADGSVIVNPAAPMIIDGAQGANISIRTVTGTGHATLQRMKVLT